MAIAFTSSAPVALSDLITRIRRAVGDTDTSVANQRWADAEILDAINLEMMKMGTELGLKAGSGYALAETTMTYTGGQVSVTLPAGPRTQGIYMVEDITQGTSRPTRLVYTGMDRSAGDLDTRTWSLLGDAIALKPYPAASLTLRIRYVRTPYIYANNSTDQHPYPVGSEELLSLGPAIRLQTVDDEVPPGRREQYNEHWLRFLASAKRMRGKKMVMNDRRYR